MAYKDNFMNKVDVKKENSKFNSLAKKCHSD